MNSPSDTGAHTATETRATRAEYPSNWKEAIGGLIASRFGIFQIEGKEAAGSYAKRLICLVGVAICAFFAWCLLLAGVIALIADNTGWSWYWLAIGAALLHLLVAIVCAVIAKGAEGNFFQVTRAELEKDIEWLQTFQKTEKSND